MRKSQEEIMNRCLQLAKKGLGSVSPNPMVGCVIVYEDRIIGEGWHQYFGGPHAEVQAIQSVANDELHLLSKSTLYVCLEPCNHLGKTPPCTDLILDYQIPKVVVATTDINPKVSGAGIQKLREHGVQVEVGLLEEDAKQMNRRFFTSFQKQRPYIILKWAQSADGFFAPKEQKQVWLSTELTKRLVHRWRKEEDSILVGKNTAIIDNPKLTNRLVPGGKQPTRIILGTIPNSEQKNLHLFDGKSPTILASKEPQPSTEKVQYISLSKNENALESLLSALHQQQIQSIIIEGGAETLSQFIHQNLWDEARVITSNTLLKNGIPSPTIHGVPTNQFVLDTDRIDIYSTL